MRPGGKGTAQYRTNSVPSTDCLNTLNKQLASENAQLIRRIAQLEQVSVKSVQARVRQDGVGAGALFRSHSDGLIIEVESLSACCGPSDHRLQPSQGNVIDLSSPVPSDVNLLENAADAWQDTMRPGEVASSISSLRAQLHASTAARAYSSHFVSASRASSRSMIHAAWRSLGAGVYVMHPYGA
jgi:hypothetical protein